MEQNMVRGTKALLLSLMEEGVDTIFGYPGGTIMPLYDELYNYTDKINHILVRHEQGAVHAAEGYARTTGKVGVCMATAGPGATNFVTGIADAMMDSTPIICITAQVNADKLGTNFFQEADMISITLPITKWSYQITKASEIPEVMAKAFYIAQNGKPGPVVISIAKNAQVEMIDFKYDKKELVKDIEIRRTLAENCEIEQAAKLINEAKRPLVIAGHGVAIANAEERLREFCEKGNLPVAATLMGVSVMNSFHPNYIGAVGMHGNIAPNRMTQEADVIVAVGMRFSDRVTGETRGYAPKAKVIHIEIDQSEINKNIKAHLPLRGDAAEILESLMEKIEYVERKEWFDLANELILEEDKRIFNPKLNSTEEVLMGQVVAKITDLTGGNAIIVTDVGQNQMFSARYSKFVQHKSFVTSGGLGTMGFGLPAAVGTKVGNPDRQVIAILGDGGFQMNMQELGTIMQSGIDIKIVLLNNSFLGMVRQWQELFFNKRYAFTHLDNPDFQKVAQAYNIPSGKISRTSDIEAEVKKMLESEGAYFLEVEVKEEENVFPMIPAGATLDEMIYENPNK
ncbi:MAG: biosynthetic-type acetolactate synthase large subunit [Bacteroidales bacterium]|nr:biosynthetic-type acetolactate synthase large subunit [Bacteroidales bacterium]